jgi:hypothetical protein
MNRKDMVWVWTGKRTPAKLGERDKNELKKKVEAEIEKSEAIKKVVSKIVIKAGRVYLYELYEPTQVEGVQFTVPLIDGKYIEMILARITVYDKQFTTCTLDYQRYNNEWMIIDEGTLEECINKIETGGWFDV